jgi:hypothetical protein
MTPAKDVGLEMVEIGLLAADLAEVAVAETLRQRRRRVEKRPERWSNSME